MNNKTKKLILLKNGAVLSESDTILEEAQFIENGMFLKVIIKK